MHHLGCSCMPLTIPLTASHPPFYLCITTTTTTTLLQVTRLLMDHYVALKDAPGSTHAANVDTATSRVQQALEAAAWEQLGELSHILATSGTSKTEWEVTREQVEALLGPAEGLLQVTPEEYSAYGPFHD